MSIAFDRAATTATANPDRSKADYINCPLSRAEYEAFVAALLAAPRIPLKEFEQEPERYFEGCMPVEVLAGRDLNALPMDRCARSACATCAPVAAPMPWFNCARTTSSPHLHNMVGFQTNILLGLQEEILRMIPGLAEAEFVRLGQMHRNTFINSPTLLRPTLQFRDRADLFVGRSPARKATSAAPWAGWWRASTAPVCSTAKPRSPCRLRA